MVQKIWISRQNRQKHQMGMAAKWIESLSKGSDTGCKFRFCIQFIFVCVRANYHAKQIKFRGKMLHKNWVVICNPFLKTYPELWYLSISERKNNDTLILWIFFFQFYILWNVVYQFSKLIAQTQFLAKKHTQPTNFINIVHKNWPTGTTSLGCVK